MSVGSKAHRPVAFDANGAADRCRKKAERGSVDVHALARGGRLALQEVTGTTFSGDLNDAEQSAESEIRSVPGI